MKQNTTYKQTELGLIPEDWEVKKLGKVGEIDKKSLNSNTDKEYEFDYISLSDVDSDQFSIKTSKQKFKNAPSRARRIVKKGDVLLSTVRPNLEGFTIIRDEVKDLIASTGFAVITSKNELHNEYLFNFLFSNIIKRQFHKLLVGSNYPAINSSDVKNLKIPLPPLLEQKKIADCLSTWDCAIEKQSQLINALTQRKKALMQQLLTGKKRLPRFEGKWNLNSINDLFIFKNGKAHENDIDENGKYILVNSKFISTDGEISKKTNSNLAPLEVNDLVFVMSDVPNGKALAKFCLIKEDNLYTLNQRIGLLKIKKGNPIFMYYLLNRNSYFLMFDNGVGQTNLRKDDILDCPLNIPSLSEQTAIAEILATADRELQLQKEKLAQLQQQKKGLMQVLLTGKKRLIN
ncbi:restriction endonuclease subunit S [Cloacibacterium caeni]|uniref:restriction endonuclease subunit S n=1 Tax=Cloacibacterium caeni TaxID=2004710 RepID=UPI001BD116ED|nr:restriction endonuclease subunit S [Cloacibacterium caeni]